MIMLVQSLLSFMSGFLYSDKVDDIKCILAGFHNMLLKW